MSGLDTLLEKLDKDLKIQAPELVAKLFFQRAPHDGQLEIIYKFIDTYGQNIPIFVQSGRKVGKQLQLEEELLTTEGFKKVKDIQEGDQLFGPDGKTTQVLHATHPEEQNYFKVCFSDGSTIEACEDHLWEVYSKKARKCISDQSRYGSSAPEVLKTKDLILNLRYGKEWNYSIPAAKPIELEHKNFDLDPYLLGVWLGDGSKADAHITKNDSEVFDAFTQQGFEVVQRTYAPTKYIKGLLPYLQKLNLIQNKHVPEAYLYGSKEQRLALLQGLMDADGYADKNGKVEFCSTTPQLADSVHYLACSLGCVTKRYDKIGKLYGVPKKKAYMVSFYADPETTPVFRLKRKLKNQRARKKPNHRFIVSITPIGRKIGRCFEVNNTSHLYLAGRSLIPTHNTETASFLCFLHAILTHNPSIYFIAPYFKQAKEILWATRRIQHFAPWLVPRKPNESELRLPVINDGFIKLDGADNIDTARGFTPSLVIYDEYKDFKPGFHTAMEPNLMARKAQLVVFGTPPESETEYFELADIAKRHGTFFQKPTSANPYIDPIWLKEKKAELIARGEEDVWAREYEGRFVRGGSRSIFPMFNKEKLVQPHEKVMEEVLATLHKLELLCVSDPATISTFGVLFLALNRYTKTIYVLKDIYESNPQKTSVDGIVPQIKEFTSSIPGNWDYVSDEAAAWFINEASQRYNLHIFPTSKAQNKKEVGLAQFKDILLADKLIVSDQAPNFVWECENYVKDQRGNIPKEKDHLIDCARYSLGFWNYDLNSRKERESIERQNQEQKRFYTMDEDFPKAFGEPNDLLEAEFLQEVESDWEEALQNDW